MAQQLIFTSTPQGLEPGRSGYCTVARHKDLRHRLVRELERLSVYDFGQQTGANRADICIFRKVPLGSEEFYVLTKICDAGLDYTNRTNYLAHHLILDGFEIATCPSPAEIFLNWAGWLRSWPDGPKYFGEEESVNLTSFKSSGLVPCQSWLQVTNDPGNAASLVSPELVKPIVIEGKADNSNTLLTLFAESSALLKISLDAWDFSFTTFLQGNDDAKGFSWIGIQGQPAGEKLKQGVIRNYLDIRNWAATELSDPVDPNLENLARKGPTKAVAKKKSSTVAKVPFSEQELQRARASAPMQTSVAPSGSTVFAQEADSSKTKKKRPWLLQLAVISTALCLLVALIVGLAYNLGDWFRDDEVVKPSPVDPTLSPDPQEPSSPLDLLAVIPSSPVQLDRVEYLKLHGKHPFMDWVEVEVGSNKVIQVKLDDDLRNRVGKEIQKMEKGEELEVIIQRDAGNQFSFESIEKAPLSEERGRPMSLDLSDKDDLSLSDDEQTLIFGSGEGSVSLSLGLLSSPERKKMLQLYEMVQAGSPMSFKPRVKDGRIVHYQAIRIPSDPTVDPVVVSPGPLISEPTGKPRTLPSAKGEAFFELAEKQRQIFLLVDAEKAKRIPYVFREDERDRILALAAFLEKGEQEVDLDIRVDGDRITSLSYELPPPPSALPEVGLGSFDPKKLVPERVAVLWIPGKFLADEWALELSRKNYSYRDSQLPDYLADQMEAGLKSKEGPRLWMADFTPRMLLDGKFSEEDNLEQFTFERDRLGGSKIITFSVKSDNGAKSKYSFDLVATRGESIDLGVSTDHARNSAQRGKVLRIPSTNEGKCIDLFILSNKHKNLEQLNLTGSKFSISRQSIRFELSSPPRFLFAAPVTAGDYRLGLAVKNRHADSGILVMHKPPKARDMVYFGPAFNGSSIPRALLVLSDKDSLEGDFLPDFTYLPDAITQLQTLKLQYEAEITKRAKDFPSKVVLDNLQGFIDGTSALSSTVYDEGSPFGDFVFKSMLAFLRKSFDWDEVRFSNMRGKLEIYSNSDLPTRPKLFHGFLEQVSKEVEDYLGKSMSDFDYSVDKATLDTKLFINYLKYLLLIEKSMGLKDDDFLRKVQEMRDRLASPSPEKLFGKINKEVSGLGDAGLTNFLKISYAGYLKDQTLFLPPKELSLDDLKKACAMLSSRELLQNYKKQIPSITQYEKGRDLSAKKIEEFSRRSSEIINSPDFEARNQVRKMVSALPWTLSLYSENSKGEISKLSDFLRLAPPQIQ